MPILIPKYWQKRLNVLYERNWTRLVHEQLMLFETTVLSAARTEGLSLGGAGTQGGHWSFSGALLYSLTVITTIGYGSMSPRSTSGKLCTMLYAVIGVPLTLLCLSSLGALLAGGFRKVYEHICCHVPPQVPDGTEGGSAWTKPGEMETECCGQYNVPPVPQGYHRVPNCPQGVPGSPNVRSKHHQYNSRGYYSEDEFDSKMKMDNPGRSKLYAQQLATVNVNHTRRGLPVSRPRPPEVTQLLAEHHVTSINHVTHEEDDEENEHEQGTCTTHDTPSRVPLIWRPPETLAPPTRRQCQMSTPTGTVVPVSVVLLVLAVYIGLGAFIFSFWEDWTLLDGAYFCFVTLSTIGFGDLVPVKSLNDFSNRGQLQLVACCGYLVVGLVLIAMAFSLIQDEIVRRCRNIAIGLGIIKH